MASIKATGRARRDLSNARKSQTCRWVDANATLARHNMYRARHQAPPLTWSTPLQKAAQDWADNCWFEHSPFPYGENIGMGHPSFTVVIDAWYVPVECCSVGIPGQTFNAGHFTQLVWLDTTLLGCAIGVCPGGVYYTGGVWLGKLYVCEYSIAGERAGRAD
ncbi:Protein PRY1 [Tetrabaena socialis]|uniref:Protein PRY1 n=1 Tax=Tetrabaena socialis TaxID=47790 RepID=A0A2J8AB70_9CHLO|nr:Protein PRY1 [Tetrabaena socialis]|eukprot:PNH09772.1 Protein PRY1 [Tetrabaena socialis]